MPRRDTMTAESRQEFAAQRGTDALLAKYYWDTPGWIGGTQQFVQKLRALVRPGMTVLDLGAGGGNRKLDIRRPDIRIVGMDVTDEIRENQLVDFRCQGDAAGLPFADASFDLIVANYVLEHLTQPADVAVEIARVLRPGGKFVFRTVNAWHYVALVARLTPARLQSRVRRGMLDPGLPDVFPTHYRCNTRRSLNRCFAQAGLVVEQIEFVEKEPVYLLRWPALFRVGVAYERLVNRVPRLQGLRSNIFAVLNKP